MGRMPRTEALGHSWYDTPNIHLCTIADFTHLAGELGGAIDHAVAFGKEGQTRVIRPDHWGPNLLAEGAIFLLHADATLERLPE